LVGHGDSRMKSRFKQLIPPLGMFDDMIQLAIKIGLWQLTYNGMWHRINHIESELIRIYCIENEECIRP
jgi:hypothetical protein